MKAIVITAYGGPEVLAVTELPDPVPGPGEVLIRVRAFGLNHAEAYMRSGSLGTGRPGPRHRMRRDRGRPIPAGGWPPGPPSWPSSAAWAGPATAATPSWSPCRPATWCRSAPRCPGPTWPRCPRCTPPHGPGCTRTWPCVPGETVLVRGATSSLGQAAVNIAAGHGAVVIATTRTAGPGGPAARHRRRRGPDRRREAGRAGPEARRGRGLRVRPGRQQRAARFAAGRPAARPGVPARLPRRTGPGGSLRPDRRPAHRRAAQLLRQRVRARHGGLPARGDPAGRQ